MISGITWSRNASNCAGNLKKLVSLMVTRFISSLNSSSSDPREREVVVVVREPVASRPGHERDTQRVDLRVLEVDAGMLVDPVSEELELLGRQVLLEGVGAVHHRLSVSVSPAAPTFSISPPAYMP